MSEPLRFWVITNEPGFRCTRCRHVHAYWSLGCRPLVFTDPEEWHLRERKIVEDFAGRGVMILGHHLGRPVEVTAAEAAELGRVMPAAPRLASWDYLGLLGLRP